MKSPGEISSTAMFRSGRSRTRAHAKASRSDTAMSYARSMSLVPTFLYAGLSAHWLSLLSLAAPSMSGCRKNRPGSTEWPSARWRMTVRLASMPRHDIGSAGTRSPSFYHLQGIRQSRSRLDASGVAPAVSGPPAPTPPSRNSYVAGWSWFIGLSAPKPHASRLRSPPRPRPVAGRSGGRAIQEHGGREAKVGGQRLDARGRGPACPPWWPRRLPHPC